MRLLGYNTSFLAIYKGTIKNWELIANQSENSRFIKLLYCLYPKNWHTIPYLKKLFSNNILLVHCFTNEMIEKFRNNKLKIDKRWLNSQWKKSCLNPRGRFCWSPNSLRMGFTMDANISIYFQNYFMGMEVIEVKRSFSRSLRPNLGIHLVFVGFH